MNKVLNFPVHPAQSQTYFSSAGGEPPEDDVKERIARLEATQDTIRAEMRAATAEIKSIVDCGQAEMRGELASMRATVSSSVDGLRVELHSTMGQHKSWLMGIFISLAGLLIAAGALYVNIQRMDRIEGASSNQQPLIFQIPASTAPAQEPAPLPTRSEQQPEPSDQTRDPAD